MTKKEIRQWFSRFFSAPKNKFESKLRVIDRAIVTAMGTLIAWSAFITRQGELLVTLVLVGVLTFLYVYFVIAKGK